MFIFQLLSITAQDKNLDIFSKTNTYIGNHAVQSFNKLDATDKNALADYAKLFGHLEEPATSIGNINVMQYYDLFTEMNKKEEFSLFSLFTKKNDDIKEYNNFVKNELKKLNELSQIVSSEAIKMCDGFIDVFTDKLPIELVQILIDNVNANEREIEKETGRLKDEAVKNMTAIAVDQQLHDKTVVDDVDDSISFFPSLTTFFGSTYSTYSTELLDDKQVSIYHENSITKTNVKKLADEIQSNMEQRVDEEHPIYREKAIASIKAEESRKIIDQLSGKNHNLNRKRFFNAVCPITFIPPYFVYNNGSITVENYPVNNNIITVLINNIQLYSEKALETATDNNEVKIKSCIQKANAIEDILEELNTKLANILMNSKTNDIHSFLRMINNTLLNVQGNILIAQKTFPIKYKDELEKTKIKMEEANNRIEIANQEANVVDALNEERKITTDTYTKGANMLSETTSEILESTVKVGFDVLNSGLSSTLTGTGQVGKTVIDNAQSGILYTANAGFSTITSLAFNGLYAIIAVLGSLLIIKLSLSYVLRGPIYKPQPVNQGTEYVETSIRRKPRFEQKQIEDFYRRTERNTGGKQKKMTNKVYMRKHKKKIESKKNKYLQK